jgi:hypothetical protein
MSMVSRWTIGAMASKKARDSSPVSRRTALAREGEVRGPVAMMTLVQSSGGSPATHDEREAAPHLLVEEADGVVLGIVRAEGVGADELGKAVCQMRLGAAHGAHLVEDDRDAETRRLPRRLAAGKTAADDVDGGEGGHERNLGASGWWRQRQAVSCP